MNQHAASPKHALTAASNATARKTTNEAAYTPNARPSTTVAADVYESLRAAIVAGEYRPNQRLIETELADRLQASRTPIRESLQRLQAEGLVASSRRGWVVREHTASDIEQIYDVRMALEGYAARLATVQGSDQQLDQIRERNEELMRAGRRDFVTFHDRFHESIVAATGNPILADLIAGYRDHPFNRRIAGRYSDDEVAQATAGHQRLVAVLSSRDGEKAEQVMHEHLRAALKITLRLIA